MKNSYGFELGDVFAGKYEIIGYLGGGWEGEVFKIRERATQIERAAKVFYPKRNIGGRTARTYAKKLHKLRSCPVLIQYHTMEQFDYEGQLLSAFISEYVEGDLLSEKVKKFRGKVLSSYQGLHLLHALIVGIESIHHLGEYHGDLHSDNIIVERFGLEPQIKLLDLFHYGRASRTNKQHDIVSSIKVFYEIIGGQKKYVNQSEFVKSICCGLRHGLILKKFPTASQLRFYLETSDWS